MPQLAILPLGAYEQHADHLPLETDTIIVSGIIERLKSRLEGNQDILFLKTQTIGYSIEHLFNKQSKSLSFMQAIQKFYDLAADCYSKHKLQKIIMLNAHGGNSPIMSIAATELRYKLNMLCVCTSWSRFGLPPGLLTEEERKLDIHAGFIETSLMLHLAPQSVDMSRAENFINAQSSFAKNFTHLRAYGPHSFGWLMQDLNKRGACGNATKASAQAGQLILDYICTGLIELIEDVRNFDVSSFQ